MPDDQQPDTQGKDEQKAVDVSSRSARAMLCQAVNNGWPIPDDAKKATVQALLQMLVQETKAKKARNVASIARTLAALNGQNQADQHLQIKQQARDEERDYELPDESANIRVMFPINGPQSAGDRPAATCDDDAERDGNG